MLYNAQVRKCQSLIIEYYHNPMLCKIGFIMPCAIVLPDISILLQISRFLTKQHLLQNINRSHGISPFSPCYVTVESIYATTLWQPVTMSQNHHNTLLRL